MQLTKTDKKIISMLQEDLPLSPTPYKDIALNLGISEDYLLKKINNYLELGIIRRFGATLKHREIGFKSNAMVVWIVPDHLVSKVGKQMAAFKAVSHCYQRPTYPDWPYNLFTMIHGQTKEECIAISKEISNNIQVFEYKLLFSTQELKKTSMQYFRNESLLHSSL
ncbi:Lrp/AsnC family transcriptional regulator [Serpentinicella sp. ANB-PHB4]|uniref:siroheme decarboxylase subunit beta n=1 Tax=Serpentinicella sp. ANB-PHB4 TaxID=3074076 RepID=UPI002862376F|nr:Lrp/AsnC family transcriptional regulator [Serpentinicella sp. ANB-PHB4]MDR5659659.1 Lrp/AsnC family transcriptional regulator [Serpentinicella sp. ANB-PHB4]